MPRSLRWLALSLGLTIASSVAAAPDKPQQVKDLHYGEVLFHFYQEDYFTAITHLMVAQQQDVLKHHREESELLLGGLQLSYGMLDQAERQFDRLLDTGTDAELHDRVWYYLTKIAYQRGRFDKARQTLEAIGEPRDKQVRAELALLRGTINMALGDNARAAEALAKTRAPDDWEAYLRINRGIALLRAGDIQAGREALDELGDDGADNEELRALRDRANLGLGYELLRHGDPDAARRYLNRVRLQGPFMQAALLGAGWADIERGDYAQALTPWLKLLEATGHEPAVHEARLAVPYAFSKLGDRRRTIHFYEQAIAYFDDEQSAIEQAIVAASDGTLLSLLAQADTGTSGGWLHENPTLEGVPSGRYLVDVLAGHNFQESLKDYRDLGYLESLLGEWLENIDLYHDMVDARREAYAVRAPKARERLARQEATALSQRWQQYRDFIDAERRDGDPLHLATGKEKQQWRTLQAAEITLAGLPDEPRLRDLREKTRWLQGILYWQIQSDYKDRLWTLQKQINALQAPIGETLEKHREVATALADVKAGFDGYGERIEALRARILELLPGIRLARTEASSHLQRLTLKELELRKQRLASYRSQARYALARSYDQLAHDEGGQP